MYEEEWKEYRALRLQLIGVLLGYIPAVGLFTLIEQQFASSFVPCMIFAVFWLLLFLIAGVRYNMFTCPRCGETFAGRWWYTLSYFARRCQHCGLRKFEQ